MELIDLKDKLERAINQRLEEFKDRSERYGQLARDLELEHDWLILIAKELKSVEYIVRESGNDTHADLVNHLLQDHDKKEMSAGQEMEEVLLLQGKKKR